MRIRVVSLVFLFLIASTACRNDGEVKKDYWENGNPKSVLRYKDGMLNGVCTWYFANGKPEMEVSYKDNKMDGRVMRWYENGNLMDENWYKDGVQDSVSYGYSLNGIKILESHYVDGEQQGDYHRWYENGQTYLEGQYTDGMMDGSWMVFYSDGKLAATAQFDKGTGVQTGYEHSGYKCKVTHYADNVKHGKEIFYNPDGTVTRVAVYEYGEWVRDE